MFLLLSANKFRPTRSNHIGLEHSFLFSASDFSQNSFIFSEMSNHCRQIFSIFPRSTTTRLAQLQPPDGARNCFPGFRKPRTVRSVVSSLDASDLSVGNLHRSEGDRTGHCFSRIRKSLRNQRHCHVCGWRYRCAFKYGKSLLKGDKTDAAN